MFTCKNCGGNVKFDIKSGQLACEYCHSFFDPYDYDDKTSDAEVQEGFEATIFTCPQCGGEIISTDDTAAGFCSFCGASTVLYSRIQKEQKPAYIIPFQKTKEDCKQAYSSYMQKAFFVPNELKAPEFIDGFRGIYMPYWTYKVVQKAPISLPTKNTYHSGDYVISDYYRAEGDLDAYYEGISFDSSSSFDSSISEALSPYDIKDIKRFTPAFLSGFYADRADLPSNVYESDAIEAACKNTLKKVKGVPAFIGVALDCEPIVFSPVSTIEKAERSMFPVWFLSYRNKDRVAYATVNGQTGKVYADLPVSIGKFLIGSLIAAIPVYMLLCTLTVLTPGITLTIVGLLAIIANICYSHELTMIITKESGSEDKGLFAKEHPEELSAFDTQRHLNASRKAANKITVKITEKITVEKVIKFVLNCIAVIYIIISTLSAIMYIRGIAGFSNADGSFILFTLLTIVAFVFSIISFKKFIQLHVLKGSIGLIFGMLSMLAGNAVLFMQPILDAWYYGVSFIIILSVLNTLINVIHAFNILTTRKLPQFDTHKGGDDRA